MRILDPRRLLLIVMLIAGMLFLAGCAQEGMEPMENAPTAATGDKEPTVAPSPTPQPEGVSIIANGVVRPAHPTLPVLAHATGRLVELRVSPGDNVLQDDVLAVLDDALAQEQVLQAELELTRAEIALEKLLQDPDAAQLAASQASLAAAESELARLTAPPTKERLAASRATLASAEASLQALLDSAQPGSTEIQIAERQLEQAKNGLWGAQISRDTSCGQVGRGGSQAACDAGNASVQSAEESVRIAEINLAKLREGPEAQAVSSARAQVASAQAELDTLVAGPSAESIAAAKANVNQAQTSLEALLSGATTHDVALAQVNVEQAEMALASARQTLVATEIRAPAAGTIVSIEVTRGAWVASGGPIATLQDLQSLEFATINLSERDVALIKPGQEAVVSLKAYPADRIKTTVSRIVSTPGEPVGDAATFPVILTLPTDGLHLRPGMTGRVEIQGGK